MAFTINTNIASMNAQRNAGVSQSSLAHWSACRQVCESTAQKTMRLVWPLPNG